MQTLIDPALQWCRFTASTFSWSLPRQIALLSLLLAPTLLQGDPVAAASKPWLAMPVYTASGHHIPAGSYGVVLIDRPHVGTLLQLRGIAGRGVIALRSHVEGECLVMPTRFVAGDFGGSRIDVWRSDPIHIAIQSVEVAHALAQGEEVVSDTVQIGLANSSDPADIRILSGLEESHGFVVNPGRSWRTQVFGLRPTVVPCWSLDAPAQSAGDAR